MVNLGICKAENRDNELVIRPPPTSKQPYHMTFVQHEGRFMVQILVIYCSINLELLLVQTRCKDDTMSLQTLSELSFPALSLQIFVMQGLK